MFLVNVKSTAVGLMLVSLVALEAGAMPEAQSAPGRAKTDSESAAKRVVSSQFTVTVRAERDRVRVSQPFRVTVRVVNASRAPQSFQVANGSWEMHWQSSNDCVRWVPRAVTRNFIETVKLDPGQAYEKTGSLFLAPGAPLKEVVFKLGFTPDGSKQTYWSNQVTLPVAVR